MKKYLGLFKNDVTFMDLPLLCHSESKNLHTLSPYVVAIPKFWIMGDEEKT